MGCLLSSINKKVYYIETWSSSEPRPRMVACSTEFRTMKKLFDRLCDLYFKVCQSEDRFFFLYCVEQNECLDSPRPVFMENLNGRDYFC